MNSKPPAARSASGKPFHHGNLREDLLDRARRTLRESGLDELSLRQLARDAGVSHAAPRRHFPERQDLLDALAEQGFAQLTTTVAEQAARCSGVSSGVFRAVARSYIDFAITDASLMDVMFSVKLAGASGRVSEAADRFFATTGALVTEAVPPLAPGIDGMRLRVLLTSMLHGIATLVSAGRLDTAAIDQIIDDAAILFRVPGSGSAALPRSSR